MSIKPFPTTATTTPTTPPGLNVIALISGGKDSLYSLAHCIRNGHRIVALGNLYPPPLSSSHNSSKPEKEQGHEQHEKFNDDDGDDDGDDDDGDDDEDIDSFMYQTIGHRVIPLYESALGIPLYREPIVGKAVDMGRTYGDIATNTNTNFNNHTHTSANQISPQQETNTPPNQDETESLIPLLTRIKQAHPEANAISAGAILSTYQRTRIENVAARMGLVPLAWLWMYPFLPPPVERKKMIMHSTSEDNDAVNDAGLLEDMAACGCEARIIKVASGGLDNGFLWEDVSSCSHKVRRRMVKMMRRFVVGDFSDSFGDSGGDDVRAAVLGEGGEYETLAVDGPGFLWKKRIEIGKDEREERVGEGGVGYLRFKGARTVEKVTADDNSGLPEVLVRRPFLLDDRFEKLLEGESTLLKAYVGDEKQKERESEESRTRSATVQPPSNWKIEPTQLANTGIWTISNLSAPEAGAGAGDQMQAIANKVQGILSRKKDSSMISRSTDDIVFATVLLRSMADFTLVNGVYVSLFKKPNPPARVAVGCGSNLLPEGVAVMVSFVVDMGPRDKRQGLHVQSRSYWAPANIGPYSQAISIPIPQSESSSLPTPTLSNTSGQLVYVAGQIPLEPASMELVETEKGQQQSWLGRYLIRTVLSLQHLWRIGTTMQVDWWVGAVAFLAGENESMDTKARIAWNLWERMHQQDGDSNGNDDESEDEDGPVLDAWDIKYGRRAEEVITKPKSKESGPPNWGILQLGSDAASSSSSSSLSQTPPFFAVQLAQLPRESDIEWQGLGIRCNSVKREEQRASSPSTTRMRVIEGEETVTTFTGIEIDMDHAGSGFDMCIRDILGDILADITREGGIAGVLSHAVLYTTQPLSDRGLGIWPGQIIPCKSVWGVGGQKLVAGVFLQMSSGQWTQQ